MLLGRWISIVCVSLACLVGGCSLGGGSEEWDGGDADSDSDADGGLPSGLGVGDPCTDDDECRDGLECLEESSTCEPAGDGELGDRCTLSGECGENLLCAAQGACAPQGAGIEGDACSSAADCHADLYCALGGLQGTCQPSGSGDWTDACTSTADCLAGLWCGALGTCQPPGLAFTPWMGAECPPDEPSPVAYFEVPRAGQPANDFFRLPFPNDIRIRDGRVDLEGFPEPGPGVLGVDLVALYKDAIESELTGFSTNQEVLFRFSERVDADTINGGREEGVTFSIVDITEGSPTYGELDGWRWSYNFTNRYVCPNWLAIGHPAGSPAAPSTTYAAWITTAIRTHEGGEFARDEDFDVMMLDETPADPELAQAHSRYQVFRDYLDAQGIDRDTILNAAVFTTAPVRDPASRLREAVWSVPTEPEPQGAMLCDGVAVSLCAGDVEPEVRDCGAVDDLFHEIHGRFTNPMFQEGQRPYETGGGRIVTDDGGLPQVQGSEDVCFSLTIPKGAAMPADGWPVVIYSHGTGGNFLNATRDEIAGALSNVALDGGGSASFAVFGYDGAMHGDRRGGSTRGEDELFFNVLNPEAARDNILQGAADLFQIVRLFEHWNMDPQGSPTEESIRFDSRRIYFYGHSQGGTVGVPFLAYETDVEVAVLSGTGGLLIESLLHKTNPVNIALGMSLVLQELPDQLTQAGANHPALNLFQAYFDRSDAVNYARLLVRDVPEELAPRHFLQTYGLGDTYSPPETMGAIARAAAFSPVDPLLDDYGSSRPVVTAPVTGNFNCPGAVDCTAVLVQYEAAEGSDGHWVAVDQPNAVRQVTSFFATAATAGVPTLVVP